MKKPRVGTTVVLLAVLSSPLAASGGNEANRQIVLGMIEAINTRNLEALDAVVAQDVVRHSAATPGVVVKSLDQFKAFLREDFRAVPDSHITVEIIFATDEMVAVRSSYAGTQSGPMGPFPASGRKVELPFMGILRIEDGKIAEMWVEWDNVHMLTQLGHLAPPGAAATAPSD